MAGCVLLALISTVLQGAEVYRSTGAGGTVIYSDRPQSDDAETITIATPGPRTSTPAPQPSTARTRTPEATADPAAPAAPPPQTAEERAAARAKNCTTARERLDSYSISHRLYRTTESGEREYLNDDEIDEARARAAADVETWCD